MKLNNIQITLSTLQKCNISLYRYDATYELKLVHVCYSSGNAYSFSTVKWHHMNVVKYLHENYKTEI
jgi:hypothetical protein